MTARTPVEAAYGGGTGVHESVTGCEARRMPADFFVDPADDPRFAGGDDQPARGERAVFDDYLRHYRLTFELKCSGLAPSSWRDARCRRRRCRCSDSCATSARSSTPGAAG